MLRHALSYPENIFVKKIRKDERIFIFRGAYADFVCRALFCKNVNAHRSCFVERNYGAFGGLRAGKLLWGDSGFVCKKLKIKMQLLFICCQFLTFERKKTK